jgi:hypothetical protein
MTGCLLLLITVVSTHESLPGYRTVRTYIEYRSVKQCVYSEKAIRSQSQSQSYFATDGQSVSMSWCRAQSGTFDQRSDLI